MRTRNSKAFAKAMSQSTNEPMNQSKNRHTHNRAHWLTKVTSVIGQLVHCHRDESGQDLVEWTVGLPVFMILCAGIVFYAWMWWNQVAAATAVHDGTYLAAMRGGDMGAGYARTQQMLRSAVGGFASSYSISIVADAGRRSVAGSVRNSSLFSLPYLGALPLNIQAQSFQRLEQFYGGPPQGWW